MLYQQPAAATKRLLGISRSSSSWPRSNRRAPPLPRPRSSWPRPLTSPCLRPPVSSPPTTSTKSTPIRSSARASCSSCRYSQKGSPPVSPQSMRPPQTIHPVSLTIPIVAQSAIPKNNVGAAAHDAGAVYHQWWTTKTLGPGVIKHVNKSLVIALLCGIVLRRSMLKQILKVGENWRDCQLICAFFLSSTCHSYACHTCSIVIGVSRIGGIGRH